MEGLIYAGMQLNSSGGGEHYSTAGGELNNATEMEAIIYAGMLVMWLCGSTLPQVESTTVLHVGSSKIPLRWRASLCRYQACSSTLPQMDSNRRWPA
jgi:hypothetical protein